MISCFYYSSQVWIHYVVRIEIRFMEQREGEEHSRVPIQVSFACKIPGLCELVAAAAQKDDDMNDGGCCGRS